MIRKLLHFGLKMTEKGSKFEKLRPLAEATDSFFFKPNLKTLSAPHIRDSVDLKRWMVMVIFALIPCILMAIWNTGVQNLVYTSANYELMDEFLQSSRSFKGYFSFCFSQSRYLTIFDVRFRIIFTYHARLLCRWWFLGSPFCLCTWS